MVGTNILNTLSSIFTCYCLLDIRKQFTDDRNNMNNKKLRLHTCSIHLLVVFGCFFRGGGLEVGLFHKYWTTYLSGKWDCFQLITICYKQVRFYYVRDLKKAISRPNQFTTLHHLLVHITQKIEVFLDDVWSMTLSFAPWAKIIQLLVP